ncbi:MAG: phosphatase PAP2 family protein [Melioribacter sp.]|nr:phosphatase PAP2 family protein [Melioribacter sp.]
MIKKILNSFYEDLKSIYKSFEETIKKNILSTFLFLLIYITLFFIDPLIREWFSKIHNYVTDFIFNMGHFYGKFYLTFYAILFYFILGVILQKDYFKKIGVLLLKSFLISGFLITILKSILGRSRPYTGNGHLTFNLITFGPNEKLSLPSGNVGIAFVFSTITAYLVDNKIWKCFWYLMAVITSFSRIYNDQHWFTDVIMAAAISVSITKHNIKRSKKENRLEGI